MMKMKRFNQAQNQGGSHVTAKKKKETDDKSLEEIISPALSELGSHSREARNYLISLAKNGSLEQHQTRGNIIETAEELLRKLRRGNNSAN